MLKKIIAFSLLVSLHAFAYELPVGTEGNHSDVCNTYANKKTEMITKEYNVKFKPYSAFDGEKAVVDKDWNETNFRTNLSVACALGQNYAAHQRSEADSIKWTLQSNLYDPMYQAAGGQIPGDEVIKLIKDAVIFGRSVK